MNFLKTPMTSKEQVQLLVKNLDKQPAGLLATCLMIEGLADGMINEISDEKFNALVDLVGELENSVQKQFELVKSIKLLLDMPVDKN